MQKETENSVDSQEFIETQFESQFNYVDFCKLRFGDRVPHTSTQNIPRQQQHTVHPSDENESFTEIEILDQANEIQSKSVAVQTESNSDAIDKSQFQQIMKAIKNLQNDQQTLMSEFLHLRYNRLNIRYLVDSENAKFTLPFNDLDIFLNFDTNLNEDREATKQMKSIFMKEDGYEIKKFIRTNFKNLFTKELPLQFTFNGRQGNLAARKFNVVKILEGCAMEKFPQITQAEFNRIATNYFYYLKDQQAKLKRKFSKSENKKIYI